jgi:tetratricopeptide (TPR) repeat protein
MDFNMESRARLNLSTIEFDRFNLSKLTTPELLQAVQDKTDGINQAEREDNPDLFEALEMAKKAVDENPSDRLAKENLAQAQVAVDNIYLPSFAADYKKLAVFHAFQTRKTAPAILYSDKYLSLCLAAANIADIAKDGYEFAEALNLYGYAQAMHPDYAENEFFEKAIEIFKSLLDTETDDTKKNNILMQIAFAERYLGLMARRRKESALAQEIFARVLEIQMSLLNAMPAIKIDLAETLHLIGATKVFEDKNEEAIKYYGEAIKYGNEFVSDTGAPHFMEGITRQSLGLLYGKMGNFNDAVGLLFTTAKKQEKFYGQRAHADIAKTINFLAETYARVGFWDEAIKYFTEALDIKETFYAQGDPVLVITQKMLLQALNQDFTFDWNDYLTLKDNEKKISAIKNLIARMPSQDVLKLNDKEKQAYGQLLYKLGAYEVHINSDEESALKILNQARAFLSDHQELAWVDNHIAFCHQKTVYKLNTEIKKLLTSEKTEGVLSSDDNIILSELRGKKQVAVKAAESVCDRIINAFYSKLSAEKLNDVKLVAFAFCILSFTQYESDRSVTHYQFDRAEQAMTSLCQAINLYDLYNLKNDGDQFARALNRLANMREENNRLDEAKKEYEILATHWETHLDTQPNPHKAKFHDSYSIYFEKVGNLDAALKQSEAAHAIRLQREPDSIFTQRNAARITALQAKLQARSETPLSESVSPTQATVSASVMGLFGSQNITPASGSTANPVDTKEFHVSARPGG